jgi:hypothetical protein
MISSIFFQAVYNANISVSELYVCNKIAKLISDTYPAEFALSDLIDVGLRVISYKEEKTAVSFLKALIELEK